MVNFREGKIWTPEMKRKLIQAVVPQLGQFSTIELFELLRPDFDNTMAAGTLQCQYYELLKKEPEAVREVLGEMAKQGVLFRDPFVKWGWKTLRANKANRMEPTVKAVVTEEQSRCEDTQLFDNLGRLVEGLSKFKGVDTSAFLNGLVTIVTRATSPEENPMLKEKDATIRKLTAELEAAKKEISELTGHLDHAHGLNQKLVQDSEKLREDLEVVSGVINQFNDMNAAGKLANVNMVTRNLKITIDKYGNVLKAERKD